MKKKVRRIKLTSLVLTLAILLGCLPTYVFAVETGDSVPMADTTPSVMTPVEETTAAEIEETVLIEGPVVVEDEEIGAVAEVVSLRTADTKHFRLDDGTYTAVRYAAAVHRQDAEGTWQDIDNRLILKENANTKTYQTPDQRITLASGYAPGAQLLTLSENGYTVSLGLMADTTPGNGHISTEEQPLDRWNSPTVEDGVARPTNYKYDTVDEAIRFDSSSSLTYHDIRANTDLEYELHGNTVKENIIVGARAEAYEYTFMLQTSGLTATAEEDGSISLKDATTGEAKYTIPAPYMYDAVGESSTAVAYELAQVKDGLYLLNVTADKTWINAEDRAFPVTIDPTIVMTYENVLADAYTVSYSPGSNYGSDTKLYVYSSYTTYIKMELPELPAGASFDYAYLDISYYYALTSGSSEVEIYPIYTTWYESTITHEMANGLVGEFPGFSMGPCLATQTLPASSSITADNPGLARFYVDEAASDWYDGEANNGIAIKWKSGNNPVMFYSREAQFEDSIYFVVSYTPGVADGVYALRNKSSSTRWMTVESDSPWAGKHIQQAYSATSPAETTVFDRSSLFKISRVGYTDRYIIRSMLNNNLSFGVSGTEIITKTIPSDDADVAAADTFYISWNGTGFIISPYSNRNIVIHMGSTSTANLTTISKMSHTAASRWEFVAYGGSNKAGGTLYYPTNIVEGELASFSATTWSTLVNANSNYIYVGDGYQDMASSVWYPEFERLTIYPKNSGSIGICVAIYKNGVKCHTLSYIRTVNDNTDPLYKDNISFVRYTDITTNTTSHLLTVIGSSVGADDIFIVKNMNNNLSRSFLVTDELIAELNDLETAYHSHLLPFLQSSTEEAAAHAAKGETDQLVDDGYITYGSSEYYGAWASNYNEELNIVHTATQYVSTYTAVYGVYLNVSSIFYSYMSSSIYTVSATQYQSTVSQIDDIANQLTNNPGTTKVMLGTDDGVTTWYSVGQSEGMTYFYSAQWDDYVSLYGDDIMEAANKHFLHKQKMEGKEFYFSHNPMLTLQDYPNSYFAKELNWLKDAYGLSELTSSNFAQYGSYWKFIP